MSTSLGQLNKKPNTIVSSDEMRAIVHLHQTDVFILDYKDKTLTLNTGGWHTPTTFRRMNEACETFGVRIIDSDSGEPRKISNDYFGYEDQRTVQLRWDDGIKFLVGVMVKA